jgi:CRP-like cAMP-binding protein
MQDLLDIASVMRYYRADICTRLFEAGDEGDLFYILVNGACDVLIPILKSNLNPEEFY